MPLLERERWFLEQELQLLEELNAPIARSDEAVKRLAEEDPRNAWLRSIPGLGPFFAALLLLEIDTIERFASPAKPVAYTGLRPSTSASGGKVYHGRLVCQANRHLRWAFIKVALLAIRSDPGLRGYYERLRRRKGPRVARVATTRRLAAIVYHVLRWRASQRRPRRVFQKALGCT